MTLAETFAALLPGGFAVAASDPREVHPLFPEEALAVASAIQSRRAEFAAGRAAARRALARLGLSERPIPMSCDRAPVWPAGFVASITHTSGHCAAAAARQTEFRAVGIDLEQDEDLPAELVPTICLPVEQNWLGSLPAASRGQSAQLIFCAKEAVYKCQYPMTGRLFGFEVLHIQPDPPTGTFRATFQFDTGPVSRGTEWQGAYSIVEGLIATAVAVR